MSGKIRFISDPHFNHENIAKKRGFKDSNEMNRTFIDGWNSVVDKGDSTYILGDITMEKKKGYEYLSELKGYKFVILGNHDRRQDVKELLKYVDGVAGMFNYGECVLTHCPINSQELNGRYKYNIHGHTHSNFIIDYVWDYVKKEDVEIMDKRYINVCAETLNYIPKTLEELLKINNGI